MSYKIKIKLTASSILILAVSLLIVIGAYNIVISDSGSYSSSKHADPNTGVSRDPLQPKGICSQCHFNHGGEFPFDYSLFTINDNSLCQSSGCHEYSSQWPPGDFHWPYPGNTPEWFNSAHGSSTALFPPTSQKEVRFCLQCHNPHGAADSLNGSYPSATAYIEENGCYSNSGIAGQGCHGSNNANRPFGADDIFTQVQKLSRHSIESTTKLHSRDWSPNYPYGRETRIANSGDLNGVNRHVECVDCHNPHKAISGIHNIGSNIIGGPLLGSWGVEPIYGPAWSLPLNFITIDFNNLADGKEYQLCFKCHSYFAYGNNPPAGATDISREFNPANLSYHPVANQIPENSYTSPSPANNFTETMKFPWDNGMHDLMTCSDCHGSELTSDPAGPHGSNEPHLLKASTGASLNDLCLQCHKADVYAPIADPGEIETGSRFDVQTTGNNDASHYFHVTERGLGCRQCHGARQIPPPPSPERESPYPIDLGSTHGTNIFIGLMNGANIVDYAPGTCYPTCHGGEQYLSGPE